MSFENAPGVMDKVYTFDDLKVYVDATSAMYLNGCVVDFVETLEASGFKFENPNVKSTCGCGLFLQRISKDSFPENNQSLVAMTRLLYFSSCGVGVGAGVCTGVGCSVVLGYSVVRQSQECRRIQWILWRQ